jgi:phosphoglucomutase
LLGLLLCRIQSLFNALGDEVKGQTIGLGGDGRYFNKEASQTILKLAAGNGIKKVRWRDSGRHARSLAQVCLWDL